MMSGDDLLASLRAPVPERDSLFWARLQRDVRTSITRRRRVVRFGSLAAAAALMLGVFAVQLHHPARGIVPSDVIDSTDEAELSLGVVVEELSDDEVARAMKHFPQGG